MELNSSQKSSLIGLTAAIFVGCGYYFYSHFLVPAPSHKILNVPHEVVQSNSAKIVHISGAVKSQGVYRVGSQSRIFDLVKLAGGALPGADFSSVNLAEVVKDGQAIVIPTRILRESRESGRDGVSGLSRISGRKININTASAAELDELPGVGPATAKKIIGARPFSKLEDIAKIPRFGKSKYEKLKEMVSL